MAQYVSHLRLASRLTSKVWEVPADIAASIIRGLKKVTIRQPAKTFSIGQFHTLVKILVRKARIDLARFVIVAYHFMHRVQSELAPLQSDGKSLGNAWRSRIRSSANRLTIDYHRRKNAPHGSSIRRSCICAATLRWDCGVCALKAHISEQRHLSRTSRVFSSICVRRDLALLQEIASTIGLNGLTWHSFRRSSAQHMLMSGCPISQIIHAGGWKSGAFLQYLSRQDVDDRAHLNLIQRFSDSEDE